MSINFLTKQIQFANARVKYTVSEGPSYTALDPLPYTVLDDVTYDPQGPWEQPSAGVIKVGVRGTYRITAGVLTTAGTPVSSGNLVVDVDRGSGFNAELVLTGNDGRRLFGTGEILLNAGDLIRIVSNSGFTFQSSPVNNYVIISRQSDFTHGSPVGFATATEERKGLVNQGEAVANTTDVSDTATQLNALLASLRAAGIINE